MLTSISPTSVLLAELPTIFEAPAGSSPIGGVALIAAAYLLQERDGSHRG